MSKKSLYVAVACATAVVLCSCWNKSASKRTVDGAGTHQVAEAAADETMAETESLPEAVDFFGVGLRGEYQDVMSRMYEVPVLAPVECCDSMRSLRTGNKSFAHIVEFCGVPCGMNATVRMVRDTMSIYNLNFITSQTDEKIIDKFVLELKRYYGEPYDADEAEDSYCWHWKNGQFIRARHLHVDEGGWTVYFHYLHS